MIHDSSSSLGLHEMRLRLKWPPWPRARQLPSPARLQRVNAFERSGSSQTFEAIDQYGRSFQLAVDNRS